MSEHDSKRGHGHHRHSKRRRFRRWFRHNKKVILIAGILVLVIISGAGFGLYRIHRQQMNRHVSAGNSHDVGSGYRKITYDGKEYRFNNLVTTVLYAGVDSEGKMEPSVTYTDAPRADSIALVVLNKKEKKMTIVAISRDTMTEIRRYTLNGTDRGTYVSHLGFAYTYGEGGEVSCENLRESVSRLFGDIPIDEYAVTNMSSIPYINQLVGGVTVEVPNNDVAELHPELTQGTAIRLDDSNVYDYLHYRDTEKDFSNEGRVERQEVYITEYVELLKTQLEKDLNGTWDRLQTMDDYLQTSITKNKYIGLANLLSEVSFTSDDFIRLEGEDQAGELHDEFYVDEEALQRLILDLFYEEI